MSNQEIWFACARCSRPTTYQDGLCVSCRPEISQSPRPALVQNLPRTACAMCDRDCATHYSIVGPYIVCPTNECREAAETQREADREALARALEVARKESLADPGRRRIMK